MACWGQGGFTQSVVFWIADASLSFWLNDEWVSTAPSDNLYWAHYNTTENTGTGTWPTSPFPLYSSTLTTPKHVNVCPDVFNFWHPQIVTDQQTGQKIQIVTAMKPPPVPKQQFILTTADSAGSGKVLLTSSDTHNTKQLIFTAADSLMPGRIQVLTTPIPPLHQFNVECTFILVFFWQVFNNIGDMVILGRHN